MAGFDGILSNLRRAERQLEKQLAGVRNAISSLSFGSAVSPALPARVPERRSKGSGRKRRRMSAAAKAKISAAQKARWAKQKSVGGRK
jgi:hypothetical protein